MKQPYLRLENAANQSFSSKHKVKYKVAKQSKSLRFEGLQGIGFWFFLKESVLFVITYMSHRLVTLTIHLLYGVYGHYRLIGIVSFTYYTMDLLSSNVRNFHKPLSVVCGRLYSKGDFFTYRAQRNKLLILNVVCYLVFAFLLLGLEPLYRFLGVNTENLPDMVLVSRYHILVFTPWMLVAKFLKGNQQSSLISRPDGDSPIPNMVFALEPGGLLAWCGNGTALHRQV